MKVYVDGQPAHSVQEMLDSIQQGLELPNSMHSDYPEVVVRYGHKAVTLLYPGEVEDKLHSLFGTFSSSQWEDIFP